MKADFGRQSRLYVVVVCGVGLTGCVPHEGLVTSQPPPAPAPPPTAAPSLTLDILVETPVTFSNGKPISVIYFADTMARGRSTIMAHEARPPEDPYHPWIASKPHIPAGDITNPICLGYSGGHCAKFASLLGPDRSDPLATKAEGFVQAQEILTLSERIFQNAWKNRKWQQACAVISVKVTLTGADTLLAQPIQYPEPLKPGRKPACTAASGANPSVILNLQDVVPDGDRQVQYLRYTQARAILSLAERQIMP